MSEPPVRTPVTFLLPEETITRIKAFAKQNKLKSSAALLFMVDHFFKDPPIKEKLYTERTTFSVIFPALLWEAMLAYAYRPGGSRKFSVEAREAVKQYIADPVGRSIFRYAPTYPVKPVKVTSFQVDPDLLEHFRIIAKREERSFSDTFIIALERYLQNNPAPTPPPGGPRA